MKTPKYWRRDHQSVLPILLTPLSKVYGWIDQISRRSVTTNAVDIPVICVGNLVAGGAGKTPVAIAIAQFLMKTGVKVHFLSRGYGGSELGPLRVVPDVHSAKEVGDEPLLLATVAPAWISKDRFAGAKAAEEAGADLIIMDDGFQNQSLHKDLSFVVIDGGFGLGNGKLLPAGPLRERPEKGLQRADALIIIGETEEIYVPDTVSIPTYKARIVPHALQKELIGEKVVAFAGIGRPSKFFQSLRETGADVIEAVEFPDHHTFSQDDIMKLVEKAALHNAALVTTRKDYVRLNHEARMMTTVFDIDLVFDKPSALQKMLSSQLENKLHA